MGQRGAQFRVLERASACSAAPWQALAGESACPTTAHQQTETLAGESACPTPAHQQTETLAGESACPTTAHRRAERLVGLGDRSLTVAAPNRRFGDARVSKRYLQHVCIC